MNNFEIDAVLDTFEILIDSREHQTKTAKERYEAFGVPYTIGRKLEYGDYTYNAVLPNGKKIFADSEAIHPLCAIERKMDLSELAGNFCERKKDSPAVLKWNSEHPDDAIRNRFEYEMKRAQIRNGKVVLLVENASWESLLAGRYRSQMNHKAFLASLTAWIARYGIIPIFCKAESSGQLIKEILYRDLKERLVRGEFDGLDKA